MNKFHIFVPKTLVRPSNQIKKNIKVRVYRGKQKNKVGYVVSWRHNGMIQVDINNKIEHIHYSNLGYE